MDPQDFQDELDKRAADQKAEKKDLTKAQSLDQAKSQIIDAMVQSTKANMRHREKTTTKVEIQNPGADTTDVNRAIEAINNVAVLMLAQGQPKGSVNLVDGTDLGERLGTLGNTLSELLSAVRDDTKQDAASDAITKKLDDLIGQLKTLQVAPDTSAQKSLANIEKALKGLDVKPQVNVPAPKVTVAGKDVDLTPVANLLADIKDVLSKPEAEDNSDIVSGLAQVQAAIEHLTFPVPNYVLPFIDTNGKATQASVVTSSSDSTKTGIVALNPDGSNISGGGGGSGTQYTDAASTPAHPVGTMPVYDNGGTISKVGTSNGLPVQVVGTPSVAQSGTWNIGTVTTVTGVTNVVHVDDNSGSLTVDNAALTTADLDTGAGTDTRGVNGIALGKSGGALMLSAGQQTMASSLPVAIASDQTLTVTANAGTNLNTSGLALETGGNLATVATNTTGLNSTIGTTAAGVPSKALLMGASDGTNIVAPRVNIGSDGYAASVALSAMIGLFNGSNYDRMRSIINATNSTGTGIQAVGLVGQFDDVSPTSITENQFGNLRMSANRNAYTTIRDAAGNERGANVDASNRLSIDNTSWLGSTAPTVGSKTSANSVPVVVASDQAAIPVSESGTWNVGLSKTGTGYSVSSQTALTTTATVSGSAGKFGGAMFINLNSAPAYIQVFDTTGAVTLGSTAPTFVIPIPANSTAANGVGFVLPLDVGIAIANGIKVAATTTATGASTVATGLTGFIYYN